MSLAATYGAYRHLMAWQWRDRAKLRELQTAKLRELIHTASEHVPYYRDLLKRVGVSAHDIVGPEELGYLPVTTKAMLQACPPEALLDERRDVNDLLPHRSSGSTGQPFTVFYDEQFRSVRDALFLRALETAGYRLGRKLMLVTTTRRNERPWSRPRWRYVSIEAPPEELREVFLGFAPHVLYGCVTPLRLLAEELSARGGGFRPLRGVVATAETLDSDTRRRLGDVFGCPVFDIYGMIEMGVVGWECPERGGYHIAEDTTIVEPAPLGDDGRHRLVMTNLDLHAMPFLRYETGDIGVFDEGPPCTCGRMFSRLKRVEGRLVDCVRLPDGRGLGSGRRPRRRPRHRRERRGGRDRDGRPTGPGAGAEVPCRRMPARRRHGDLRCPRRRRPRSRSGAHAPSSGSPRRPRAHPPIHESRSWRTSPTTPRDGSSPRPSS